MDDEEILRSLQADEDRAMGLSGDADPAAIAPIADPGAVPVPADPSRAFDPEFMPPPEQGPPTPPELAAPKPAGPAAGGPNETWPPPVPSEAPGMVPPAGTPNAAPGASGAAAGPPSDDIEGALGDVAAARGESDEARRKQFEANQAVGEDKLLYAMDRSEELRKRVAADEQRQAADRAADEKAQASLTQSKDAIRGFKFKDYWSSGDAAKTAGRALGAALLAIGAGMMKTPKYAIEILDKKMADDHKTQMDALGQLNDDYVRQRTGIQDAQQARLKLAADVQLGRARKDELIAAQFDEAAQRSKNSASAADATAFSAKLKQDSAEAHLAALTNLRSLHLADEKLALDEELKRAQIKNLNESAALKARGLGQGHKDRKAGGGGGAGGGNGYDDFRAAVIAATDPNNIPNIGRLAAAAHLKPNQIQTEITKIRTEADKEKAAAGAGGRAGLMGDRLLETKVKNFAAEHQIPKLEAAHRKLEEVRGMLTSGNPVAAMSALMEYDAAAKGSTATESSMHAIQQHLGGAWDNMKGWAEQKATGNFGEAQRKNLLGAIDVGIKEFKNSVEPIHQAFASKFDYSQPGVAQAAGGLFMPFGYRGVTAPKQTGGEGGHGGGDPVGTRKPDPNGVMREKGEDGKWHRVQ